MSTFNDNITRFFSYIGERENVRIRKDSGLPRACRP